MPGCDHGYGSDRPGPGRDPVQETLLAGWRGLRGFEQRSSLRTWLYRIATSFGLPRSPPG